MIPGVKEKRKVTENRNKEGKGISDILILLSGDYSYQVVQ